MENSEMRLYSLRPELHVGNIVTYKPKLDYSFRRLSGDNTKRTGYMNAILEITKMTKPELFVMQIMEENFCAKASDGLMYIPTSVLSKDERKKFYTGTKKLRDKSILAKASDNRYMYNPKFMAPPDYEAGCSLWTSLTK